MNTHHRINYIEFPAEDLESVKAFYAKAFGWTFTDYGPTYTAFSDGTMDGGFEKGGGRGKDGALVILYSENLEATLSAVTDAGGSIEKEIFDFPGGRKFHFRDPSGNELAVWSDR
ncbi:MAG: VOC family protein [Patescibacteria group bacterium]